MFWLLRFCSPRALFALAARFDIADVCVTAGITWRLHGLRSRLLGTASHACPRFWHNMVSYFLSMRMCLLQWASLVSPSLSMISCLTLCSRQQSSGGLVLSSQRSASLSRQPLGSAAIYQGVMTGSESDGFMFFSATCAAQSSEKKQDFKVVVKLAAV